MDELKDPKVKVLKISEKQGDYNTYKSVKVELPNGQNGYVSGSGSCVDNVEVGKTLRAVGLTFFKKQGKTYWSARKDKRNWAFRALGDKSDDSEEEFSPPENFEDQAPEFIPTWKDTREPITIELGSGNVTSTYYARCPACNGEVEVVVYEDPKAEKKCPHCKKWGIFAVGTTRRATPDENRLDEKGKPSKKPKPEDYVGKHVILSDLIAGGRAESIAQSLIAAGMVGTVNRVDNVKQIASIRMHHPGKGLYSTQGGHKTGIDLDTDLLELCKPMTRQEYADFTFWQDLDELKAGDVVKFLEVNGRIWYTVILTVLSDRLVVLKRLNGDLCKFPDQAVANFFDDYINDNTPEDFETTIRLSNPTDLKVQRITTVDEVRAIAERIHKEKPEILGDWTVK